MKTQTYVPHLQFIPDPTLVMDLLERWQGLSWKTAMQIPEAGVMNIFSYGDLLRLSTKLGHRLSLQPGPVARLALLSESRPEWVICLMASFVTKVQVIVLDPQLSDSELSRQIEASQCQLVFASRKNMQRLKNIALSLPALELEATVLAMRQQAEFVTVDWTQLDFRAPFLIVQGSGTTGGNKSIMISAANLLYETHAIRERVQIDPSDRTLSILPINHLFELTAGTLSPLYAGATITFANTLMPHEIVQLLSEQKITLLAGVPLFFKAMKRSIELNVEKSSSLSRKIFSILVKFSPLIPQSLLRKLLPVHKRLGGHLRFFISGGAPLPLAVEKFFESLGLSIMQGYGLSEASPVVTTNAEVAKARGSCGKALPGTEIKIVEKDAEGIGEVWIRGPQIMLGYWNDAAATAQVLTPDGWLKTGDLGYLDSQGFLFLTGRSRNLVALGAGKKVFPEEVEALLSDLPYVKEICVTGFKQEDWEEVTLVCVPQDEVWSKYANDVETVRSLIESEVRRLLAETADYKKPRRLLLSRTALPKTSTHKVKIHQLREMIQRGEFQ